MSVNRMGDQDASLKNSKYRPQFFMEKWHNGFSLYANQLEKYSKRDRDRKYLNEKFIEELYKEKQAIDSYNHKLMIINIALITLLILSLHGFRAEGTYFGVRISDVRSVSEIILCITSTIALRVWISNVKSQTLHQSIKLLCHSVFPEKMARMYRVKYATPLEVALAILYSVSRNSSDAVSLGKARMTLHKFAFWGMQAILLTLYLLIMVVSLGAHIDVIINVIGNPNLPKPLNIAAVTYTVIIDFISLFMVIMFYIPAKYKDKEMELVSKNYPVGSTMWLAEIERIVDKRTKSALEPKDFP